MATVESLRRRGPRRATAPEKISKGERRWSHRPLECRLAAVRLTLPVVLLAVTGIFRRQSARLLALQSYISHGLRIQSHDSPAAAVSVFHVSF
ncbi:hypothetical protein B296_00016721 [Ensete ventricosum]|uniref:Uncharacterized protein n=1 Tax=Ensete ventricosum TaxID=4639 RepID=A0A426Z6L4_ENSVE|nr:hypothetical protein B296_00016721 [Ensete ventricosum]